MLRTWQLNMQFNHEAGTAIYLQIAQHIIAEIQQGRLPPTTVMPGTRELSLNLKLNRKTVVLAYDELIAQGWLVSQNRRGTFVATTLPTLPNISQQALISEAAVLSLKAPNAAEHLHHDEMLDFTHGEPDTRLIPYEAISRAFRHALLTASRAQQMGDDDAQGSLALRSSLVSMLNIEKGLHITSDEICLVRGSQMGIYIAARTLTQPQDIVVFERLSDNAAREAFSACGAQIMHIDIDADGMQVDQLEALCQSHPIKVVYVTPQHQYPTTVSLSPARRIKLIQLAAQYGFTLFENDHDHDFNFSAASVFPLMSEDKKKHTVYLGSLAGVLAPGFRIAYLVASPDLIKKFTQQIALIDKQGNNPTELAIANLMDSGELSRHILRMSKIYKERRAVLEELIKTELNKWLELCPPQGGLAFWLRLKEPCNMQTLKQLAKLEKVNFAIGSTYADNNTETHAIRLGFASLNEKELSSAVKRLQRALIANAVNSRSA